MNINKGKAIVFLLYTAALVYALLFVFPDPADAGKIAFSWIPQAKVPLGLPNFGDEGLVITRTWIIDLIKACVFILWGILFTNMWPTAFPKFFVVSTILIAVFQGFGYLFEKISFYTQDTIYYVVCATLGYIIFSMCFRDYVNASAVIKAITLYLVFVVLVIMATFGLKKALRQVEGAILYITPATISDSSAFLDWHGLQPLIIDGKTATSPEHNEIHSNSGKKVTVEYNLDEDEKCNMYFNYGIVYDDLKTGKISIFAKSKGADDFGEDPIFEIDATKINSAVSKMIELENVGAIRVEVNGNIWIWDLGFAPYVNWWDGDTSNRVLNDAAGAEQ